MGAGRDEELACREMPAVDADLVGAEEVGSGVERVYPLLLIIFTVVSRTGTFDSQILPGLQAEEVVAESVRTYAEAGSFLGFVIKLGGV